MYRYAFNVWLFLSIYGYAIRIINLWIFMWLRAYMDVRYTIYMIHIKKCTGRDWGMGSSTTQWDLHPVVKYHLRRCVGLINFFENGTRPQPPTSLMVLDPSPPPLIWACYSDCPWMNFEVIACIYGNMQFIERIEFYALAHPFMNSICIIWILYALYELHIAIIEFINWCAI